MNIEKIKLKKLELSDLDYRVSLLNHASIRHFLNTSELFTLKKTIEWFNNLSSEARNDFVFLFEDKPIGMGGLVNISHVNKNAELYIYLDPFFQGRGLGSLSLQELCNYGFTELSLHKIYLYTFSRNLKANQLYERNGFLKEGFLREHTYKNGILCDRNIYSIFNTKL